MKEKIIEAIVTGSCAAATWAVILFAINYGRNKYLEYKLEKSFQDISYTAGRDGWGITLHNLSNVPVKVSVVLLKFSEKMNYVLNFSGQKTIESKEPLNIQGEKVKEIYMPSSEFEDQKGERIIDLDFEMSGSWLLTHSSVVDCQGHPTGGHVLIEYPTIIGGRKRIKIEFDDKDENLKKSFEHHKNECETNKHLKRIINAEKAQKKTRKGDFR